MTIALTRPTQLPVSILRWVELIAWPLILGLALWLRLENIGIYTGSFDEGIRSEQMLLMAAGFRPFREIFASQGPLLLDLLFPFYLLFGQSLEAIRLGVVVMSVVALLGAGWTARLVAGRMAGIATLALLSVSPAFLESSRLALAETPSLAPSIWAIAAALRFQQSGLMRWAAAAGVLLAVGVLVKPMVVPVIATVGLLVLLRMPVSPRGIGLFIVAAGGVSCLVVLALGPSGVYDDLAAYRGGASHKLGNDAAENFRLISGVLSRERLSIVALAALGALGSLRNPRAFLPLATWPVAVVALFFAYDDLADKHIVYLAFPLLILAGIGVGLTLHHLVALIASRQLLHAPIAIVGIIASLSYLGDLQRVWRVDQFMLHEAGRVAENRRDLRSELEIAEIMVRLSRPDEFVLTDNPGAAFRARRMVPPKLVDTSGTRIDAGSLTDVLAISTVQHYQPPVIVTAPNRMGKLSGFVRWMTEGDYRLVKTYEIGWKLYLRRDLSLE